MNCQEFEILLADALGDELSLANRAAFETHLAGCDACRGEYETARRALADLRSLPSPQPVFLRRDAEPVAVGREARAVPANAAIRFRTIPIRAAARRPFVGLLRYAAGLLLAFTAGYALHAGLTLSSTRSSRPVSPTQFASGDGERNARTLEAALARVHAQNPMRSDLAKALIAMVPRR